MTDQPILVAKIPDPADRTTNKPVYLLVTEAPDNKLKISYFRVSVLNKHSSHVEFKGVELESKTQVETVRKDPQKQIAEREINFEIPWQKIIRIENLTYKLAQGK